MFIFYIEIVLIYCCDFLSVLIFSLTFYEKFISGELKSPPIFRCSDPLFQKTKPQNCNLLKTHKQIM